MAKIPVSLFGSGAAGIEFVEAIPPEHPDFEIVEVRGHSSAGKLVSEVMPDVNNDKLANMKILPLPDSSKDLTPGIGLYCCALSDDKDKTRVKSIEEMCASVALMVSTSALLRYDPDSTIIILEANAYNAQKLKEQAENRGWKGFAAPGPNCTSVGPVISLKAMGMHTEQILGIYFVSMQAVSGAGEKERRILLKQRKGMVEGRREAIEDLEPVVYAGNVRSNIDNEEGKVKKELRKILGLHDFPINGRCNRVDVEYGHTVSMFVETRNRLYTDVIKGNVRRFNERCVQKFGDLYSSPEVFVELSHDPYGPQPLFDANRYKGMCTHIGQLQPLDGNGRNGLMFNVTSHNLKKGAAKGSVQVAEYLCREGFFRNKF